MIEDDAPFLSLTRLVFGRDPVRVERGGDAVWARLNPTTAVRIEEGLATEEERTRYKDERPFCIAALTDALAAMQEEFPSVGTCPICGRDDVPIDVFEDARPLLDSHPKPGMESAPCTTFVEAHARSCDGTGRVAGMTPHCPHCGSGLPGWYWPAGDPWRG